eukprot:gb/GECH01003979.1/.p1 GENE.gb/GECH01003979.1/~~gb/GECH01003979.1/.p1  ORF type:complete len:152 (+),score=42.96 gb/GECH01003979.1/:1-456(+)
MSNPTKRITKEVKKLQSKAPEGCHAAPVGDDLFNWEGHVTGPKDSPYADGKFKFTMKLPEDYPFHPPEVTMKTKVYHPNFNHEDGSICVDVLQQDNWRPMCGIVEVLSAIVEVMRSPEPDHALDADIGEEYTNNKKQFEKTAKKWTKDYAK